MPKIAKVLCVHCDKRMAEGTSFCPSCEEPTQWATYDERVEWELHNYRKLQARPLGTGTAAAAASFAFSQRSEPVARRAPEPPAIVPERKSVRPAWEREPVAGRAHAPIPRREPVVRREPAWRSPAATKPAAPAPPAIEPTRAVEAPPVITPVAEPTPMIAPVSEPAPVVGPAPAVEPSPVVAPAPVIAPPAAVPAAPAQPAATVALIEEQADLLRELLTRVRSIEERLAASQARHDDAPHARKRLRLLKH